MSSESDRRYQQGYGDDKKQWEGRSLRPWIGPESVIESANEAEDEKITYEAGNSDS